MKFCLEIWVIFGSVKRWVGRSQWSPVGGSWWEEIMGARWRTQVGGTPKVEDLRTRSRSKTNKTLDKTSSSALCSQGKVVDLNEIYNFLLGTYASR